jgi:hypothetical protein
MSANTFAVAVVSTTGAYAQQPAIYNIVTWDGVSSIPINFGDQAYIVPSANSVANGWVYNPGTSQFVAPQPNVTIDSNGNFNIDKIYFLRLFTIPETLLINQIQCQISELTSNSYSSTDPTTQLLLNAEVFFQRFDATSVIELNDIDTQQGLGLFAELGVFGANTANQSTRIAQITAGIPQS